MEVLYKYLPPERRHLVQDRLIRFTQPGLFNDPFEASPYLESYGPDNVLYKAIKDITKSITEEQYYAAPLGDRGDKTYEEFIKHATEHPEEFARVIRASEPQSLSDFGSTMFDKINQAVGILSLSEQNDSMLMWAHYTVRHTGFVVGFDASHEFFNPPKDENDPISRLAKVEYCTDRPKVSVAQCTEDDLFFRKGTDWAHEQEWRLVRYLKDADDYRIVDKHDCYLFEVPASCFREITFGCRMAEKHRQLLTETIRASDLRGSVRVYQSELDETEYKLHFVELL